MSLSKYVVSKSVVVLSAIGLGVPHSASETFMASAWGLVMNLKPLKRHHPRFDSGFDSKLEKFEPCKRQKLSHSRDANSRVKILGLSPLLSVSDLGESVPSVSDSSESQHANGNSTKYTVVGGYRLEQVDSSERKKE
jgi:hypothetical protein